MARDLDQLFRDRRRRADLGRWSSGVVSAALHVSLTVGFVFLPALFAKPAPKLDYVSVVVVPPAALGIPEPPPPPPPPPRTPPPEPEPQAAPPPPPPAPDVPVIRSEKKPQKKPQTRRPPPEPPRTDRQRPPRRLGSALGSSLGASAANALLGVEDPNFTYGWYLDQLVNRITSNWTRPVVGSEIRAVFYFRIHRDGTMTDLELREPSRLAEFDESARRAIATSAPFPPLPRAYKPSFLGINLVVE